MPVDFTPPATNCPWKKSLIHKHLCKLPPLDWGRGVAEAQTFIARDHHRPGIRRQHGLELYEEPLAEGAKALIVALKLGGNQGPNQKSGLLGGHSPQPLRQPFVDIKLKRVVLQCPDRAIVERNGVLVKARKIHIAQAHG